MQTELSVINALLKVIGESPVIAVDLSHPDVLSAIGVWEEISTEIQSRGWWFNLENWVLPVETNGEVKVPSNTTAVITEDLNYIKRGQRLYRKDTHTFDFSEFSTITVDIISEWTIEDLPPTAYNYILAEAKTMMLASFAMDGNKLTKLTNEAIQAFHRLQVQNLTFSRPNALATSTAQMLLRNQPRRSYGRYTR